MRTMRYLWLLFLELIVPELWALPPCPAKGDATRDVLLQNGSSFAVSCNLTDAEEGFTLGVLKGSTWLLENNTSRHVVWRKDNVQDDDRAIYYCTVRGNHCGPTVFSATSLAIAYAPLRPVEHWCIGHNLETFTCYWGVPKTWIVTTYRVSLRVGSQEMYSVIDCGDTLVWNATNVTCRLTTAGKVIYRIEENTLYFRVVANNTLGSQSWDYQVDHYANVQLNPPADVQCQVSKDSIRVTWNDSLPNVSSFPPVLYKVEVVHYPELGRQVTGERYVAITEGLVPYTGYELTVKTKFDRSYTWSAASETVSCTTPKDRPTAVPKVAVNGFSIDHYKETRNVRVYFQGVPKEEWYGEDMRYVLLLCDGNDNWTMATSNQSSHEFGHLSHDREYMLRIYSENEVGRSTRYATVTIPATQKLLPPVQEAYINASQLWSVKLRVPKNEATNATYTLFWRCGREKGPAEKDLSWKLISSLDEQVDVGSDPSSCVYAVALRKNKQVSSFTWIHCVEAASKEYDELIRGTDQVLATQMTDNSIRLAFLSKCNGMVSMRQLQYWAACDDPDSYKTVTLEVEREVTISELSSQTSYVVAISSVLEDGRVVVHEQLEFRTGSKALLFIAIVLGISFLIFAVIGCVIFVWCRRLSAQFITLKATTVEVLIPADFPQKPLRRSESIRSNYFPERIVERTPSDSTSTCQSSDVPLLASDDSLHISTHMDEEETTAHGEGSPQRATCSQLTDQAHCSGYAKVSDMTLPLQDLGDVATREAQCLPTMLPSYSEWSRTGADASIDRTGSTAGYSSHITSPPYSQLSVMLANGLESHSMPQNVPKVAEGYSADPARQPYSKIFAAFVSMQQSMADKIASDKEVMIPLPYMTTPSTYPDANEPENATSGAPSADRSCDVPKQEGDFSAPYFTLHTMLSSSSKNLAPQQSTEKTDKPPPYLKLSAMFSNQEPGDLVQQLDDSTTMSCGTDLPLRGLAVGTQTVSGCLAAEKSCHASQPRDGGCRKTLTKTKSCEELPQCEVLREAKCHARNSLVQNNCVCVLHQ